MKKSAMIFLGVLLWTTAYGITIRTAVELGRRSRDCDGAGICFIKTSTASAIIKENTGSLTLSEDGTVLTLVISTAFVAGKSGQIRGGRFIQEENYILPREVCRALATHHPLEIPAGQYTVSTWGDSCSVRFAVTDSPLGTR